MPETTCVGLRFYFIHDDLNSPDPVRVLRVFTGSNPGGLDQLDALLAQFKGELIIELDLAGARPHPQ